MGAGADTGAPEAKPAPDAETFECEFGDGSMGISVDNSADPVTGEIILHVDMIVPGSTAEKEGVQPGDELIAVNGDLNAVENNKTPAAFGEYVVGLPRPLKLTFKRYDHAH